MDDAPDKDKPQPVTESELTQTGPSKKPGGKTKSKTQLTPEEQMAAFEKAMKEEDWGHQPC
jgi:hypothetical protein